MPIQPNQMSVHEILEMIFQNKWLFLLCTFLGLLCSLFVLETTDKWYESRAEIQIRDQSNEPLIKGLGVSKSVNSRFNEVRAQVLSVENLKSVVKALKTDPRYKDKVPYLAKQDVEKAAQNLSAYLSMGIRYGMIYVRCERRDQDEAWAVVDYMKDGIQEKLTSYSEERLSDVHRVLGNLLSEYGEDLRQKEEFLKNFQVYNQLELAENPQELTSQATELGLATTSPNRLVSQYVELSNRHTDTSLELEKKRAEYLSVQEQLKSEPEYRVTQYTTEQSEIYRQREGQLAKLMADLEMLRREKTDKHPFVQDKIEEVRRFREMLEKTEKPVITQEQRMVNPVLEDLKLKASNLRMEVSALEETQKQLFAKLTDLSVRVREIPNKELEKTRLRREQGIIANIYSNLRLRYEQAVLTNKLEKEDKGQTFVVIGEATKTYNAIRPKSTFIIAMGTFLGMVVGIFFCFVREFTDTSFRSIDDASRFLDMPVLGVIPEVVGTSSGRRGRKKSGRDSHAMHGGAQV
ncbi:MAG: GumC family protein [Candidatus Sumerlaeia bacterium]